jgi:hypothetical protein
LRDPDTVDLEELLSRGSFPLDADEAQSRPS